ncbi:hypothetical protein [Tellurirhabdus rosea]|uniref:hypothetical protein n=1 Tax=Tellurirhabdus rosea TaxID=2674997 RepID=UPI002258BE3A|nr:hypothetical protein [Tellurirhabdus rosea]
MPQINVQQVGLDMLNAAKTQLGKHFADAKPFAEQAFRQLADNLALITELKVTNQITEEQARLHFEIFKSSTRIVLLTIEGLGVLAVEAAINAALGVVADVVNTAIGFALL